MYMVADKSCRKMLPIGPSTTPLITQVEGMCTTLAWVVNKQLANRIRENDGRIRYMEVLKELSSSRFHSGLTIK